LRRRSVSRIAFVLCAAVLAAAVAGCKNSAQIFQDNNEGGWFSKPMNVFGKPDWAIASSGDRSAQLSPTKPVAPEDLVSADGLCSAPPPPPVQPAPAAAPTPPPDRPVGSIAGDLARAPMPAATPASIGQQPGAPPVLGGVALGMSECEVVRRAGMPGNVNIGAGDRGDRKVVLTYLTGTWPGIYTFDSGRLKEVERAPGQPAPVLEPPKTKKAKKPVKPKTAATPAARQLN
jgi:hypothetical protein